MVKPTLSLDWDKSDGVVRCTAHDWRTGRPPLERTGWPGHAGPGPRKTVILHPRHSGGRADEGCGDPSSKYAAGRQGGGKVQEPRGQRAAEGGLHLPSHLPANRQALARTRPTVSWRVQHPGKAAAVLWPFPGQLSSTKTFLSHARPNSHGGGKSSDLKTNGLPKEMGKGEEG